MIEVMFATFVFVKSQFLGHPVKRSLTLPRYVTHVCVQGRKREDAVMRRIETASLYRTCSFPLMARGRRFTPLSFT